MSERFADDFAIEELRGIVKPNLKQAEKMIARRGRYLIRRIKELEASFDDNAEMLRKELASIVVVMENVESRKLNIVKRVMKW
jgi:hypothetical protein